MGGVRSSFWASLFAWASVAVLACGRTSRNPEAGEPQAGAPATMEPRPQPEGLDCAQALSGNGGRFCAYAKDSTVWCFGTASAAGSLAPSAEPIELADVPSGNSIVVGPRHSCVVTGRGEIWCWGDNESGQIDDSGTTPVQVHRVELFPQSFVTIKGLGLLELQTCAVDPESQVYCRGTDASGVQGGPRRIEVAGTPDTTMPGANTTAVLDHQGRVFEIASWDTPQLDTSLGLDNARVFYGGPKCVLKRWGSLWCTDFVVDPTDLPLRNVTALSEDVIDAGVGDLFMCALTKRGRVWCQGFNLSGQTANGDDSTFDEGHFVEGLEDVRALAVAHSSACVIQGDGSLWCWGAFAAGRTSNVPVQVAGCSEPSRAPERPPVAFDGPEPDPGQRLSEASRARGQAVCTCDEGSATHEDCIDEESPAPNGACLAALAPKDFQRWHCQADQLWTDARCWDAMGCPKSAANCLPGKPCPDATMPGVESYCSRRRCADDPGRRGKRLFEAQICDGVVDCNDASDERNCARNALDFECDVSTIPTSQVCDGERQCRDGSDELGCP